MGKEPVIDRTAGKGKKKPQKRLVGGKTSKGKKKPPSDPTKTKRRRKNKAFVSFAVSIHKILKQVHPECTMSAKSMSIMNSFVNDILERMLNEGSRLIRYSRKRTLGIRELQTVARLMLPGELNRHAGSEATKAVIKYQGGAPGKLGK